MASSQPLLIFGASARAAAFSALRAGLQPWCADLFADYDLQACCPAVQLSPAEYPHGFVKIATQAPPGPWMYTGGVENHPEIVAKISRSRPLWGNDSAVLAAVRSPAELARAFRLAGIPFPSIQMSPEEIPSQGRWLIKPWFGAGGTGIHFWTGKHLRQSPRKRVYYQEFIEGSPCSAVFVGDGSQSRFLGATRQLVGEAWLHAAPFHYCGSIGPLSVESAQRAALEKIGETLVAEFSLRGLFGVDFILTDEGPWPVEINPRYPASVEILESALGVSALAAHRRVFDSRAPEPPDFRSVHDFGSLQAGMTLGKAILFARASLVFPKDGPWFQLHPTLADSNYLSEFADVPPPQRAIQPGKPILTFFSRSLQAGDCLNNLRQIAQDLDRQLYDN
jgi:predicted ATP-grasp superfamily ATP-dependent carboligase